MTNDKHNFEAVLNRLWDELIAGRYYLKLHRQLGQFLDEDRDFLMLSRNFFDMTWNALLGSSLACIARLFDKYDEKHRDSATIEYLLNLVFEYRRQFPGKTDEDILACKKEDEAKIHNIMDIITRLRTLRDWQIAHLDKRQIYQTDTVLNEGQLTYAELFKLYELAEAIIKRYMDLLHQRTHHSEPIHWDDLKYLVYYSKIGTIARKAKRLGNDFDLPPEPS